MGRLIGVSINSITVKLIGFYISTATVRVIDVCIRSVIGRPIAVCIEFYREAFRRLHRPYNEQRVMRLYAMLQAVW
jgi:hypothetical protein